MYVAWPGLGSTSGDHVTLHTICVCLWHSDRITRRRRPADILIWITCVPVFVALLLLLLQLPPRLVSVPSAPIYISIADGDQWLEIIAYFISIRESSLDRSWFDSRDLIPPLPAIPTRWSSSDSAGAQVYQQPFLYGCTSSCNSPVIVQTAPTYLPTTNNEPRTI